MKITRIYIKNYRSIKDLDICPNSKLNVFIGENGVGKSNIFNAINWLLGLTYPTFNATAKQDHYLGDENNKILIRLEFDSGESLELNEHKEINGQVKSGLFYNNRTYTCICRKEIRERFCSAYIGMEREIVDYLPSNRWSLLGRILLDINKMFLEETIEVQEKLENGKVVSKKVKKSERLKSELEKIRDDLLFSVQGKDGTEIMKRFIDILQEESARQMNKSPSDFKLDLNLYDPWNFYKTLQLLVKEPETGLEFQASQMGAGTQASITIAILRAYSEIKLGGGNPIFIDEPELFLHPQAQKNLYKILRKLADENDIQIFYITHSPYMLSLEHFDEIFLVRKSKEKGTYIRHADVNKFIEDLKLRKGIDTDEKTLKLYYKSAFEQTADSISSLEAFFAKKVILVEGESEALLLPYFFEKIGFDWTREKITIVKCGGKSELDRFYRLYSEFGIPCFVIFDGDNGQNNEDLFQVLRDEKVKNPDGKVYKNYMGFRYDFNHALQEAGFENVYNSSSPDKSPKGLRLFLKVREQIENENKQVPNWVEEIKEKVLNLPDEAESVLETHSQDNMLEEDNDLLF